MSDLPARYWKMGDACAIVSEVSGWKTTANCVRQWLKRKKDVGIPTPGTGRHRRLTEAEVFRLCLIASMRFGDSRIWPGAFHVSSLLPTALPGHASWGLPDTYVVIGCRKDAEGRFDEVQVWRSLSDALGAVARQDSGLMFNLSRFQERFTSAVAAHLRRAA